MSFSGRCVIYHIDGHNKITFVNAEWSLFAAENKAHHLDAAAVVGESLLESITDETSRYLYWTLIQRIRREQKILKFCFRCDAPDRRRFMRMQMFPLPGQGVGFKSFCVREELRKPVALLDADTDRSAEFVKMCSWCKKVEMSDLQWVEVEDAIGRFALFTTVALPQLTHGMCPCCYRHYWHQLVADPNHRRP